MGRKGHRGDKHYKHIIPIILCVLMTALALLPYSLAQGFSYAEEDAAQQEQVLDNSTAAPQAEDLAETEEDMAAAPQEDSDPAEADVTNDAAGGESVDAAQQTEVYRICIREGEKVSLREMLPVIGLASEKDADQMIDHISTVESSDPDAVKVSSESGLFREDDWILEKTGELNGDEALTIVMEDGAIISVEVAEAGEFQINVATYDHGGNLRAAPDNIYPISGDYYLRVKVQAQAGYAQDGSLIWEDAGWTAVRLGKIKEDVSYVTVSEYVPLDRPYDSQDTVIPYDPEKNRIDPAADALAVALLQPTDDKWAESFQNAINLEYVDETAPEKYEFDGGTAFKNGYELRLKRANAVDYHVRLAFDGAESAQDVPAFGDDLYALVSVKLQSATDGQRDVMYGVAKVTDDMMTVAGGTVVADVPVPYWRDADGTKVDRTLTGAEKSVKVQLVRGGSEATVSDLINGQDKLTVGDAVSGYTIIQYPTSQEYPQRVTKTNLEKRHTVNMYDVVTLTNDREKIDKALKKTDVLTYEGDGYDVTVAYGADAGISGDTDLAAGEVTKDSDDYDAYKAAASKALGLDSGKAAENSKKPKMQFAGFYDITLSEDGSEVEPTAPVDVNISYNKKAAADVNAKAAADLKVVHITKEEGSDELKATVLGSRQDTNNSGIVTIDADSGKATTVSDAGQGETPVEFVLDSDKLTEVGFTADSFSVYAVAYTVDFHYGEYSFSIAGEGEILLSEVFARLHIEDIGLNDVKNVTFSAPELISVEKVNSDAKAGASDWKLTSLKPFSTNETLTIALKDGKEIVIHVTDAQYVCKITDKDGKQLYYGSNKAVAVFDKLENAFSAVTSLYTNSGSTYSAANGVMIQMLAQEYTMTSRITVPAGNITLTTAGKGDSSYAYAGEEGTPAKVYRSSSVGNYPLFTLNNASTSFILQDITLNGNDISAATSGGAMNVTAGKATLNNGTTIEHFLVSGDGGGGLQVTAGSLTMNSGSVIQNCEATGAHGRGGGVFVNGGNANFTMNEGCLIQYCKAWREEFYAGGGVCVLGSENFIMNGGTIQYCEAPAPYRNNANPGGSGGGIGIDHHEVIHIKGGLITNCSATNRGGAIESHGGIDISGGTITKCHSGVGGGINFYRNGNDPNDANAGDEAVMFVSGSPKIYGNYQTGNPNQPCNVDINHHYTGDDITRANIRIITGTKLRGDAVIGVYAGEYGDQGKFGIYRKGADLEHLSCFTNDRDPLMVGTDGGDDTYANNGVLVWSYGIRVVAKMYSGDDPSKAVEIKGSEGRYVFPYGITTGKKTIEVSSEVFAEEYYKYKDFVAVIDGPATYQFAKIRKQGENKELAGEVTNIKSTLTITGVGSNKSWSYDNQYKISEYKELHPSDTVVLYYKVSPVCKVTDEDGNLLDIENGNPAIFCKLETAFEKLGEMYRYDSDELLERYHGSDRMIKMIVPAYTQAKAVDAAGSYDVALTTGSTDDALFPLYKGNSNEQVNSDTKCTITNDSVTDKPMIEDQLDSLTLTNVTIDGGGKGTTYNNVQGGIIKVSKATTLTIGAGVTLRNSTAATGGAVYAAGGATVNMLAGAEISGNTALNGGAVYLGNGAVLDMRGGTIQRNSAANGGAIEFKSENGQSDARLRFSGSAVVYNNPNSTEGSQKNVILSADSNDILSTKAEGLTEDAAVGIYVPDANSLFTKHGGAFDPFGTNGSGNSDLSGFVNDRNGLKGAAKAGKIIWTQTISVIVKYAQNVEFRTPAGGAKPAIADESKYTIVASNKKYTPTSAEMTAEEIAEDVIGDAEISETAQFWKAFVQKDVNSATAEAEANRPADYTALLDNDNYRVWKLTTLDNPTSQQPLQGLLAYKKTNNIETTTDNVLEICFTEPIHLVIDNQSGYGLMDWQNATIDGRWIYEVITQVKKAGSAQWEAYNHKTDGNLNFELQDGQKIEVLIPGGAEKPYVFSGGFLGMPDREITATDNGRFLKRILPMGSDNGDSFWNFTLNGNLTAHSAGITTILFGKQKYTDLTISKEMKGKYADLTRDNEFEIALPVVSAEKGYTAVRYKADGTAYAGTIKLTGSDNGFALKNGEKIVISDVPVSSDIQLTEKNADGYTLSVESEAAGGYSGLSEAPAVDADHYQITFALGTTPSESGVTLKVTNTCRSLVPTGVSSPAWTMLMIALIVIALAAGSAGVILRRRRAAARQRGAQQ